MRRSGARKGERTVLNILQFSDFRQCFLINIFLCERFGWAEAGGRKGKALWLGAGPKRARF
jgi:hypothetical protein